MSSTLRFEGWRRFYLPSPPHLGAWTHFIYPMFWKNIWWYIFTVKLTIIELRELKINRTPPVYEEIPNAAAEYGLARKMNNGEENSTALFTSEFELNYQPYIDELLDSDFDKDGYEWLVLNAQR